MLSKQTPNLIYQYYKPCGMTILYGFTWAHFPTGWDQLRMGVLETLGEDILALVCWLLGCQPGHETLLLPGMIWTAF